MGQTVGSTWSVNPGWPQSVRAGIQAYTVEIILKNTSICLKLPYHQRIYFHLSNLDIKVVRDLWSIHENASTLSLKDMCTESIVQSLKYMYYG